MQTESWIEFGGPYGETEEMLLGNRSGLTALRDALDTALASGEAKIAIPRSDLILIRLLDAPPTAETAKATLAGKFIGGIAFIVVLFVVFLTVVGLITFAGWF